MGKLILKYLFPTPIWDIKVNGYGILNEKLKKHIYSLKEKNPQSEQYSNVGGWHGDLELNSPEISNFFNIISPFIKESLINMGCDLNNFKLNVKELWTIINSKNSYNTTHIHPDSVLSIAYYVKTQKNSGNFFVEDPRPVTQFSIPPLDKTNILNLRKIEIEPEEGLLLIFPSYLPHLVGPNKSEEDRIVISMNINLIPNG